LCQASNFGRYNGAVSAPEFVAIGHVTLDRIGDVVRPGGAAAYAAITAERLGLSAGILTSHADDFPLDALPSRIEVVSIPAAKTTAFEHQAGERPASMRVHATAGPLIAAHLPDDWRGAPLVLLAPVVNEVDPLFAAAFDDASVGAAAQGWLRAIGQGGAVRPLPWDSPALTLRRLQALFLSGEDVRGQEASVTDWVQRVPLAVVTAGARGGLLYVNGDRYELRPRRTREVDATGAGDVFAATFMARYRAGGDPWDAAEAATGAASLSVEDHGWAAVPDAEALARALKEYRRHD